jgi:hypothetical protein
MANIFDYLIWRGDLTLAQSEFNEIDNLILARFSYFPFDHIIKQGEIITIEEASNRFKKLDITKEIILQKEDIEFFINLGKCERFAKMKITNYINKVIPEEEKQFSAITILMPDDTIYISFRGTDNTLVGWKEDFNMSFQENVPSQIEAVQYTKSVAQTYNNRLRIGGHSKGGNIAVYAASFSSREIQDRIINVYNNDGPGFQEEIIQSENYQRILNKVHTFVPQTSIIGRLLYHEEKYTVIQSTQSGVMQHDLYTWQLQGKKFVYLDEVDNGSQFIDKTIKDWLSRVSNEQRAEFINSVFEILQATDADTLAQIKEKWVKNAKILISTYKNMDEDSKKMMVKTIEELFVIIKDNVVKKIKPVENK